MCKFTTEAIIAEGSGKGTTQKVCANPDCPIHHPKKESSRDDGKWRAEQERQRKQEAISRATGLRTLEAIGNAVPVRLMKRELLYPWHTFRHTYRSWLDETGAPMKVQQELMRHASIQTTMNVYGQAMPESKREANGKVVTMVLKPLKASA